MAFKDFILGDLFDAENGKPKYIKTYIDQHLGDYPVYSASLAKPFGYISSSDYDGEFLTWVMNGYGGRIQELSGKFSINRDRGLLRQKPLAGAIDLTYLKYVLEPALVARAVGRRVDGQLNEYTKIYPNTALSVSITLPVLDSGELDFEMMAMVGNRLRRVERAQVAVRQARDALNQATFAVEVPEPFATLTLGDERYFELAIGDRVLLAEHTSVGVPAYSANVLTPFACISKSNLSNFDRPSLLWGIDGNFAWNFIPANIVFATTDHCGRVLIKDQALDPEYIYWYLRATSDRYGFDRVYRAKLENVKADISVAIPLSDRSGGFCKARQREWVSHFKKLEAARAASIEALETVMRSRIALDT